MTNTELKFDINESNTFLYRFVVLADFLVLLFWSAVDFGRFNRLKSICFLYNPNDFMYCSVLESILLTPAGTSFWKVEKRCSGIGSPLIIMLL